jgi:hypothetical protein
VASKPARSRVGVFSRSAAVRDVDGRTREAKIMGGIVAELTGQLGGRGPARLGRLGHGHRPDVGVGKESRISRR